MCVIERFIEGGPPGKSPRTEENVLSLVRFYSLEKIKNIKICHMVAKEYPEVIEGRGRLIAVDGLDSEEAAEDASVDNDGAALDE